MLYFVATPIGNLEDITLRALRILKEADYVAAEDTRTAHRLLSRYEIKKPVISFFDYNKTKRAPQIIRLLKEEKNVAFISEAGTPTISDPGYYLIKKCIEEDIPFTATPGPSAVLNALVLSGLPTDAFYFLGFLPHKSSQRLRLLKEAATHPATLIFFESPHRLVKTLLAMKEVFGNKRVAVVREMTKIYEEARRGAADELASYYQNKKVKGEIVIVVDNRSRNILK